MNRLLLRINMKDMNWLFSKSDNHKKKEYKFDAENIPLEQLGDTIQYFSYYNHHITMMYTEHVKFDA